MAKITISYKEKRVAYDGMKSAQYFEPDMELLRKEDPDHELSNEYGYSIEEIKYET